MAENLIQINNGSLLKDGFYYRKALQDQGTSAELFYHPEGLSGKSKSLGRTILEYGLSTATQVSWGVGTSLLQYIMAGIATGASEATKGIRDVINAYQQARAMYQATTNNEIQSPTPLEQSIVEGADTTHKKYQSSYTDIAVPPVTFFFINENDTDFYLNQCRRLLLQVLPRQEAFNAKKALDGMSEGYSIKSKEKDENGETKQTPVFTKSMAETLKSRQTLFYIERPPGDLKDPFTGYNLDGIIGFFSLRLGYKRIYYLVPTSVRVQVSKSGSTFGAPIKPVMLSEFENSIPIVKNPTRWRPHFISVTITFDRIGKIFTKDISTNLLFSSDLNDSGPTVTPSNNIRATNQSSVSKAAEGQKAVEGEKEKSDEQRRAEYYADFEKWKKKNNISDTPSYTTKSNSNNTNTGSGSAGGGGGSW